MQKDFCLSEENGKLTQRKDHTYYYQVQCQLLVLKADFCNFVLWTTADFAVVHVEPNKKFAAHCQEKAKAFFDNVVLPELVAKYYTNMKNKSSAEQPPVPDPPQKRPLSLSPQKPTSPAASTGKISTCGRKKARILWCVCLRPEDFDDMVARDNLQSSVVSYRLCRS